VRVRKSDKHHSKSTEKILLQLLRQHKILGATVWSGIEGFGKRGKSVKRIEGIAFDNPVMIEIVDERDRLEPLLTEIKRIVDDNGLVTVNEIGMI
jgi:PII-like signaling protein